MTTVLTTTTTPHPTEINFLADDQNKGFKVRVNSDLQIAIFDLGEGLTGKSRKHVRDTWTQLKRDYPRIAGKCHFSKFVGLRKKTPSCDIETGKNTIFEWPENTAFQNLTNNYFLLKCSY